MDKKIIAMCVATSIKIPEWLEENVIDRSEVDNMKPNMNFYQTKMHRRKKGGKVNFK